MHRDQPAPRRADQREPPQPRHRLIPRQLIAQQRHQQRRHHRIKIPGRQPGAQQQAQRDVLGRAARHQPQQPRRRARPAQRGERQRPGGGDPLVIPGRIPLTEQLGPPHPEQVEVHGDVAARGLHVRPRLLQRQRQPAQLPGQLRRRRLLRGPGGAGAVQQEPRRHRPVQHRHLQHRPARPGPELAGDHHPPPARRRHQPRHRRRVRHVIEHQQPVIPAGQHRMHPPHRITPPSPAPRCAASSANPAASPAGSSRRQLPHHRAAARLPVGVLHRHAGLARTPQPAQHHHPRTRTPPRRQAGLQPSQQLLPARQEHRPRRQPHRHPGHHPPLRPGPAPAWPPAACCKVVSAWNSSISSRSGESTRCTVIPASSTRSRNARCRSPNTGSDRNTCGSGSTAFSSSTNTSRGNPSSAAAANSSSVYD